MKLVAGPGSTRSRRRPVPRGWGTLAIILHLLAGWAGPSILAATKLAEPVLLTQVPHGADPAGGGREGASRSDAWAGARLVVLSPDGQTRVISEGFHSACDPSVAFDGRTILFAGRREESAPWRVYEMDTEGRGARPVSPEGLEARSPIYVSTLFTLDSPEPWFTTVFVGRRLASPGKPEMPWPGLFNVKLDGSELRQLTYHPGPARDPMQVWDGRVIYAAMRPPLEAGSGETRGGLFGIHIEGADAELYTSGEPDRSPRMPCAADGGWLVFVESTPSAPDGAGQLACVHESRPHHSYRRLTDDPAWRYRHPSPGGEKTIMVARRPAQGAGTWGLVGLGVESGLCDPIYDSPEFDEVQAVLLAPRARPDGHSTVVNPKATTGIFYCLNAYDADERWRPHLEPGTVKRVRFIETISPPVGAATAVAPARRFVGEAPVEKDGSLNVEVPAGTPMLLQTLDERGLALATCGWIWVQPKETRGCVGCHEDPGLIPENLYVEALRRPSNRLVLPPEQRRSVSFRADVANVFKEHCATADCHGSPDSPLPMFVEAGKDSAEVVAATYQGLLTPLEATAKTSANAWPPGKYVDAGRARTSWLVWQLVGANTRRPWDRLPESPVRTVKPMPPPDHGQALSREEIATVIQWIDLGAPLDPTGKETKP